jgi:hypothetical protein
VVETEDKVVETVVKEDGEDETVLYEDKVSCCYYYKQINNCNQLIPTV